MHQTTKSTGADAPARVGRDRTSVAVRSLSEDVILLFILLCENEAVLCAIKNWVGQGGKATLATAPDSDILREIVCLLTQRVQAGRATFLIKVKSHRGEPTNERADTLAEEGREISDDDKRWDDRSHEHCGKANNRRRGTRPTTTT